MMSSHGRTWLKHIVLFRPPQWRHMFTNAGSDRSADHLCFARMSRYVSELTRLRLTCCRSR